MISASGLFGLLRRCGPFVRCRKYVSSVTNPSTTPLPPSTLLASGDGGGRVKRVMVALGATLLVLTMFVPTAQAAPAVPASPAASWSPWKACLGNPQDNCAVVRAITRTSGGVVFLGGVFSQLRSPNGSQHIDASNLVALNDVGTPVTAFSRHTFNGAIFTLATNGTSLYVGGSFSKIDGQAALHIARFSVSTGARLTFKSNVNGAVYGSALAFGKLYIGGKFGSVQGFARGNLAAVDPASGAVDPAWAPAATLIPHDAAPNNPTHNNIPIRTLAASQDLHRVYVGGDMDLLDGHSRPAIAALNPESGALDQSFAPAVAINKTYQGMAIAVVERSSGLTPGVILAAGGLSNRAWRLGTDGRIVWTVSSSGDVQAAAVLGRTVYLGGHFDCISVNSCFDANKSDDIRRLHIAAFSYDGSGLRAPDGDWTPDLGPAWSPYYYGVWALQAYGPSLYVGGVFPRVVAAGTTYSNAKYVRFGPAAAGSPEPPPTTGPPSSGSLLFTDDFSAGNAAKWSGVGHGMTVSAGAASGVAPGKIAYLATGIAAAQPSVDFSCRVNLTRLDPSTKVVIMKLSHGDQGIVDLAVRPDGTMGLRNESTRTDWPYPLVLSAGAWHTIDLRLVVAGMTSTVQVSVDGVIVPRLTGQGAFGSAGVDRIQIGDTAGKKAYSIQWDDIRVTVPQ